MEDREADPTQQLERDGLAPSEPAPSSHAGLIFVCDPSADAERLMVALRTRGYPAIDVPLGLLPSRLRYQLPDLVLCDADAPDALERVREMRAVPGAPEVRVVFLGSDQGAIQRDPAFRVEGHGVFFRPLDVEEVCSHITILIGPPNREQPGDVHAIAPRRAPVIVPSARKPYRSDEGPPSNRTDALVPTSEHGGSSPRASLMPASLPSEEDDAPPELSPETRALLDRAHAAASVVTAQSSRPTRLAAEETAPADVDFDVLAALESPLDEPIEAQGLDGLGLDAEPSSSTGNGFGSPLRSPSAAPSDESDKQPRTPRSYAVEAAVTNPGGRIASQPAPSEGGQATALHSATALHPTTTLHPATATGSGATVHGSVVPTSDIPVSAGSLRETVAPPRRTSDPAALAPPPSSISAGHEPVSSPEQRSTERPGEMPRTARLADLGRSPEVVQAGGATRILATAISSRATGALALQDPTGIRRVVLRDGDIVTAVSGGEDESLVRFLEATGDLEHATAAQLARTLPPFGRHAGAGLIAHGHLQQEDLWPVLRAHSEWILAAVVGITTGRVSWEEDVPIRLQDEPAVFGGAAGSEVFVEVVRRTIDPAHAWDFLGAGERILGHGGHRGLLGECALEPDIERVVQEAVDAPLDLLYRSRPELIPILYALVELDVLTTGGGQLHSADAPFSDGAVMAVRPQRGSAAAPHDARPDDPPDDPLDDAAFQARVMARRALVDEGDYFSILGVKRSATEYELSRAHEDLHRQLSPARMSARTTHLADEIQLVLRIVDEAYQVLRDPRTRERYRRALEAKPG